MATRGCLFCRQPVQQCKLLFPHNHPLIFISKLFILVHRKLGLKCTIKYYILIDAYIDGGCFGVPCAIIDFCTTQNTISLIDRTKNVAPNLIHS